MASLRILALLLIFHVCTLNTNKCPDKYQRSKREAKNETENREEYVQQDPQESQKAVHSHMNFFQDLNNTILLEKRVLNSTIRFFSRILNAAIAIENGMLNAAIGAVNGILTIVRVLGIGGDPVENLKLEIPALNIDKLQEPGQNNQNLEELAQNNDNIDEPTQNNGTLEKPTKANGKYDLHRLRRAVMESKTLYNARKWDPKRRLEHSKRMKAYWAQAKTKEGINNTLLRIKNKMLDYWKRKREDPNWREWRSERSKTMKKYWAAQKELQGTNRSKHIESLRSKMTNYWDEFKQTDTSSKRELLEEDLPKPVNDPAKGAPWYLPTKVETIGKGIPNTADYRVYFKSEHGLISPLHDIPLYSNHDRKIFNMVVEAPRLSNTKLEMSLHEPLNPLKHETINGQIRHITNIAPHYGFMINYGALPNTWANPEKIDPHTGYKGEGDPLDVVELGKRVAKPGEVIQVKVLGAIGVIDEGKTDWKIIAIDVTDSRAQKFDDIADVEKNSPGYLKDLTGWLEKIDCADGKPKKTIAFKGEIKDREFAHSVIDDAQEEWIELMAELGEEREKEEDEEEVTTKAPLSPRMSVVNTCIRGTKGKISFQEAEAILNNRTFLTKTPGINSQVYEINITASGSQTHKMSV
ncbi:hypothetical protein WDU94_000365 [Cyamophila willieti]